jgi:hypothetical protein
VNTDIVYNQIYVHSSLLLQHVLIYWPPTSYFAFIVSTAVVRYTLAKVQLVNLYVQYKLMDDF